MAIAQDGYWNRLNAIDVALAQLSTSSKNISALKTQIQFRRIVLQQQHPDRIVFQWSSHGRQFTWEELRAHLCLLLPQSEPPAPVSASSSTAVSELIATTVICFTACSNCTIFPTTWGRAYISTYLFYTYRKWKSALAQTKLLMSYSC